MHMFLLCNEKNITVCCRFPQLHSYQILLKLVNVWLSYSENKKGEFFLKHSVFLFIGFLLMPHMLLYTNNKDKMLE